MRAPLRRRISRARRALDFAIAHPLPDSGYTTVINRLKAEIDQADGLGMLQGTGDEREHAALLRRQTVKKTTATQLLRRLCRLAKVAAADHPDLANKFVLPRKGPTHAFVLKAEAMLADAVTAKDVLSSVGLGDNFITQLTQAVADLDSATDNAHAARNDHVGATGGLPALLNRCDTDVAVLDTFMQVEFANDAQALAAWRSAKNLAGPFKAHAAETPPVTPAPEPGPVVPQLIIDPPTSSEE
jgi:hypothetical protein